MLWVSCIDVQITGSVAIKLMAINDFELQEKVHISMFFQLLVHFL